MTISINILTILWILFLFILGGFTLAQLWTTYKSQKEFDKWIKDFAEKEFRRVRDETLFNSDKR